MQRIVPAMTMTTTTAVTIALRRLAAALHGGRVMRVFSTTSPLAGVLDAERLAADRDLQRQLVDLRAARDRAETMHRLR